MYFGILQRLVSYENLILISSHILHYCKIQYLILCKSHKMLFFINSSLTITYYTVGQIVFSVNHNYFTILYHVTLLVH